MRFQKYKPKTQEKMLQEVSVRSLKATEKSVREIEEITGVSKSKVDRLLKPSFPNRLSKYSCLKELSQL